MTQLQLPEFDGVTYERDKDFVRLSGQLGRVKTMMSVGRWWTLRELAEALKYPEASISARIRDLRKPKFGGFTMERRRRTQGTWEYRMIIVDKNVTYDSIEV